MALVEFVRVTGAKVTIRKTGNIFLGNALVNLVCEGMPKKAYYFVDSKEPKIAFLLSENTHPKGTHPKKLNIEKAGVVIYAKKILKHFNIPVGKTYKNVPYKVEGSFIILDLKEMQE